MALQLKDNIYGIEIDAYIKLVGVDIREIGEFENGEKKYNVLCTLNYYTNETKEFQYKQEVETLEGLKENELSLGNIYGKIMGLEKFNNSIFI